MRYLFDKVQAARQFGRYICIQYVSSFVNTPTYNADNDLATP